MIETEALQEAIRIGSLSPCAKSKRGVVLSDRGCGLLGSGYNHPPDGFVCDASQECQANCNKLCVHAEMDAVANFTGGIKTGTFRWDDLERLRPEMVHVKVVDGEGVPSGGPSCWQCSRHVINFGITAFWLLHEDGLRCYSPDEFHELTLKAGSLPVIR